MTFWDSGEILQLRAERDWLRKEYDFLKGKCERLEQALLSTRGIEVVEQKPSPIEQVTVEAPRKSTWQKAQEMWNSLSEEEQTKRLGGAQ
jgi:hypothetical protein